MSISQAGTNIYQNCKTLINNYFSDKQIWEKNDISPLSCCWWKHTIGVNTICLSGVSEEQGTRWVLVYSYLSLVSTICLSGVSEEQDIRWVLVYSYILA